MTRTRQESSAGLEFLGAIRYRGDNLVLAFRFANHGDITLSATVGDYKLPAHPPLNGRVAKEAQKQISKWAENGIIANHFLVVPFIPKKYFNLRRKPVQIVAYGSTNRTIAQVEIPTIDNMFSSCAAGSNKVTKGLSKAHRRGASIESARSQASPITAQSVPLFPHAPLQPVNPLPAPLIALAPVVPAIISPTVCDFFMPTQWTANLAAEYPRHLHTYRFVRNDHAGQFVVERANALPLANLVNGPLLDHTGTFNLFAVVLLWDI